MKSHLIPVNEYRRERWKNGLGWTREIIRQPLHEAEWQWRISIAEIEKDSNFSAFPGCDRELVLLSGQGMSLQFSDGNSVELLPPYGRHRFTGELVCEAHLMQGATHDFNVIWKRDAFDAQVLHRPLVGPMVFFNEAAVTWMIYLASGQAHLKTAAEKLFLEQGDSAILQSDAEAGRAILDGGGDVILVKLQAKKVE